MAIITYDSDSQALYISLGDGGVDRSTELDDQVTIDFGWSGNVIGIEVKDVGAYQLEAE